MLYFTVEELGPQQSLTPEGFLLCRKTPIGRLGMQTYAPEEIADENGKPLMEPVDGVIRVDRVAAEVFHPRSMASARGKAMVDEHPRDDDGILLDVTPENWVDLAIGQVLDVYRGEGIEDDLLFADLQFTVARGISLVQGGKRQLSIGYNCDYYQTAPGRAEQRNIVINHIALVENGRCGPRCAIGDSRTGGSTMADATVKTIKDLILRAFKAKTADEVEKLADEAAAMTSGAHETHVHVHPAGAAAARDAGEEKDKDGKDKDDEDDDEKKKARDARRSARDAKRGTMAADDVEAIGTRFDALEEQYEDVVAELDDAKETLADLCDALGVGQDEMTAARDARRGKAGDKARDARRSRDARDAARKARDDGKEKDDDKDKEIEGHLKEEAPAGTGDKAAKARDSAYLSESYQDTVAMAEIIAPGIEVPEFKLAERPTKTFDDICGLRKRAVTTAYATADGKEFIDTFLGRNRVFDAAALRCETAKSIFTAYGMLRKKLVTADQTAGVAAITSRAPMAIGGTVKTQDDLNKLYAEHYSKNPAA